MVRPRSTSPWQHVTRYRDRHGRERWRWRKRGAKTVAIPGEPGSAGFMAAIAAAEASAPDITIERHPHSFAAAVASYYQSASWRALRDTTRKTYRNMIEGMVCRVGSASIKTLTASDIRSAVAAMADRPGAANNMLKRMRAILTHAVETGVIERNPAREVRGLKLVGRGASAWTADDCAQFEERWPRGSTPRLAYMLLRELGQRRGDVIRLGRQHIRGDEIVLRQEKTRAELRLVITPELAAEIACVPPDRLTLLSSAHGRPFTSAGFGMRFRAWCDAAGLSGKSAHGLRKSAAIELAEAGASAHEIMALTGHASLAEVERYTRGAGQAKMARAAARKRRTIAEP